MLLKAMRAYILPEEIKPVLIVCMGFAQEGFGSLELQRWVP